MVGTEVHVIVLRAIPLLALMGLGGPLPLCIVRTTVKGELAGGELQVDDTQLAPASNRTPYGPMLLARSYCHVERSTALQLSIAVFVDFVSGGFSRCFDLPDAQEALRQRFAALIEGEVVPEDALQAARAVGLVS